MAADPGFWETQTQYQIRTGVTLSRPEFVKLQQAARKRVRAALQTTPGPKSLRI